jgi:hypothetical protein
MTTHKVGRSTDGKPDEWEQDLHPQPMARRNVGLEGLHPEKENDAPNAYEIKKLHRLLEGYIDDELKQIRVLPQGSRLQQGATYIDLNDPERKEFTAMGGGMEAGSSNWYVPKTEVSYWLWNRLIGLQNPDRLDQAKE